MTSIGSWGGGHAVGLSSLFLRSLEFCGSVPPWFSKLTCFGVLISQVQVLKVGVPDGGFKPFTLQGEAQVLRSLPTVRLWGVHCAGGGVLGKLCPSLCCPLPCGPSFAQAEMLLSQVLGILRGSCSAHSCRFGEFGEELAQGPFMSPSGLELWIPVLSLIHGVTVVNSGRWFDFGWWAHSTVCRCWIPVLSGGWHHLETVGWETPLWRLRKCRVKPWSTLPRKGRLALTGA